MKRLAAAAGAIALAAAFACALGACSGTDAAEAQVDYVGTWVPTSVSEGESAIAVDELAVYGVTAGDVMTLVLYADGSAEATVFGSNLVSDEESSLTWTTSDEGVVLHTEANSTELTYDPATQQLTMSYEEQIVSLVKQ